MRPHTAIFIAVYLHLLYVDSSLSSLSGEVRFPDTLKIFNIRVLQFDKETESAQIEVRYGMWSCIGKFENNNGKVTITHSGSKHKRFAQETFKIYNNGDVAEGETVGNDRYPKYFKSTYVDKKDYKTFTFEGSYISDLNSGLAKETRYDVRLNL